MVVGGGGGVQSGCEPRIEVIVIMQKNREGVRSGGGRGGGGGGGGGGGADRSGGVRKIGNY